MFIFLQQVSHCFFGIFIRLPALDPLFAKVFQLQEKLVDRQIFYSVRIGKIAFPEFIDGIKPQFKRNFCITGAAKIFFFANNMQKPFLLKYFKLIKIRHYFD